MQMYKSKLRNAEDVAKMVTDDDWVDHGWCTSHSYAVDKALEARAAELKGVKVRRGVP